MKEEVNTKLTFSQVSERNLPKFSKIPAKSTLKGSNLMLILSDEGGLPIYTRAITIDKLGKIHNKEEKDFSSTNENIVLMSGFIEAIMQLKDIVRPKLTELMTNGEEKKPVYVDYAKTPNGIALVSLSDSPDFQQLPLNLLAQYAPLRKDFEKSENEYMDDHLDKALGEPISEDVSIYHRILTQIKSDLSEFVSFILVYDEEGDYLFSTAKKHESNYTLSDPLLSSISQYIKQEYIMRKYKENLSLIGAKRLHDSIIWHFKCYDRIFVFFTYRVPDMHTFSTLKSEMITFIANNLQRFIDATRIHSLSSDDVDQSIKNTRFIFLS
ncbi:MAG: hypothetical protein ACFFAU_20055 [Candidatus Hodarchaeota archaeon]